MLEFFKRIFKIYFKKAEAPILCEEKDPKNFYHYRYLSPNALSILHYLKTQDIAKIIKGTGREEIGLDALIFVKNLLNDVYFRRYNALSDREIKVCTALDAAVRSVGCNRQHYMKSNNPVIRVIAYWSEMESILDSMLEDLK
jgi:hypothetical protein